MTPDIADSTEYYLTDMNDSGGKAEKIIEKRQLEKMKEFLYDPNYSQWAKMKAISLCADNMWKEPLQWLNGLSDDSSLRHLKTPSSKALERMGVQQQALDIISQAQPAESRIYELLISAHAALGDWQAQAAQIFALRQCAAKGLSGPITKVYENLPRFNYEVGIEAARLLKKDPPKAAMYDALPARFGRQPTAPERREVVRREPRRQ